MKSPARLHEEECVRRCLVGDPDAFGPIYTAWWNFAVQCACRPGVERSDVEDVAQEAMHRTFRYIHQFDPRYRISTFIRFQVRVCVGEYLRKRETCRRRGMTRCPEWSLLSHDDPSAIAEARVLLERVGAALANVPGYRRRVLEDYVGGMDEEEMAAREGVTRAAISARLVAARREIRAAVGG